MFMDNIQADCGPDQCGRGVLAGTAVEAVRSVFSSNEGAEFAELLVQQLGEREPSNIGRAPIRDIGARGRGFRPRWASYEPLQAP